MDKNTENQGRLPNGKKGDESRVLPLLIAGLFCFAVATAIGFGTWSVFGSQARESGETAKFLEKLGFSSSNSAKNIATDPAETKSSTAENTVLENSEEPDEPVNKTDESNSDKDANLSNVETTIEITGVVSVDGKEFAIGGGDTKRPLQRVIVENFLISETEVTNEQYSEFVKETGHRSPNGWKKEKFPKATEKYPVVNVSWDDAVAYCSWLSKKYKMKVRLPTQAEWELAARGPKRFRYPWGNDWNKKAVTQKKLRRANPVRSYPLNKSPYGAYDMLGNVWEWTSEQIDRNEIESKVIKDKTPKNTKIFLALGGSFNEDRKKLRNTFWAELDSKRRTKSLGFRYVIIPNE